MRPVRPQTSPFLPGLTDSAQFSAPPAAPSASPCSQRLPLPPAPPAVPSASSCAALQHRLKRETQLRHPKPLELVDLSIRVDNVLPSTSQLALELQPLVFIWVGAGVGGAAGSSSPGKSGMRSPAGMGRHPLTMRLRTAVTRNIQAVPSTHSHVISDPVSVQEAPLGGGVLSSSRAVFPQRYSNEGLASFSLPKKALSISLLLKLFKTVL